MWWTSKEIYLKCLSAEGNNVYQTVRGRESSITNSKPGRVNDFYVLRSWMGPVLSVRKYVDKGEAGQTGNFAKF